MNQRWKALLLGSAFVCIVMLLARGNMATPIPFLLLLPGLAAGACVPDSHFDPEAGYANWWGPISMCVVYAVNIALYIGLAYIVLNSIRRRTSSK